MLLRFALGLSMLVPVAVAATPPAAPGASALPPVLAGDGAAGQGTDLDAFMETVLKRRDENWKKLQQYVLEEREGVDLFGPGGARLFGFRRDYTWFIRQGYFIRSPVRADGVTISEKERRKAEDDWVRREKRREEREKKRADRDGEPAATAAATPVESPASVEDILRQGAEPRFVSAAYFLKFKFESGHYALAGRETYEGRPALKIEYYPELLFNEGRTRPNRKLRERDDEIEEKMNKVSLVTLWIDAETRQILQYTFDDIDMDFLPGRSIVRVDDLKATMRMGQMFPAVWLPRDIAMQFSMTLAVGTVSAQYKVEYHDYREASVTYKVR
jgi:hypothetical protein